MPQEFIIWQTETGWWGRYEAKTLDGSSVCVTGPHRSAAEAAKSITADGMGSGGLTTAGAYSYKCEGAGGGGGGAGITTTGPYEIKVVGGGGNNLIGGAESSA